MRGLPSGAACLKYLVMVADESTNMMFQCRFEDRFEHFQEIKMIADAIKKSRKIICVTGAGISVSAGVPVSFIHFRTFVLLEAFMNN